MRITKFPKYLTENLKPEKVGSGVPDDLHAFITILFQADQFFDLYSALEFAETHVLTRDLPSIEPSELLTLFLQLHSKIANALCALNAGFDSAGQFTTSRMSVGRDTGIPGKEFSNSFRYCEHDRDLLQQINPELAEHYVRFCGKLMRAVQSRNSDSIFNVVDFIFASGLNTDVTFDCIHRMFTFGEDPRKIKNCMEAYCRQLHEKLNTPEPNPFEIATFAHQELVRIHPFTNGNGRLARLIMNIVLMHYNCSPVPVTANDYMEYCVIVEKDLAEGLLFADYIMKKSAAVTTTREPLFPENPFVMRMNGSADYSDVVVVLHPRDLCYDMVLTQNMQGYFKGFQMSESAKKSAAMRMFVSVEQAKFELRSVEHRIDAAEFFRLGETLIAGFPKLAFYCYMRSIQMGQANKPQRNALAYIGMTRVCEMANRPVQGKWCLLKAAALVDREEQDALAKHIERNLEVLKSVELPAVLSDNPAYLQQDDGIRASQIQRANRLAETAIGFYREEKFEAACNCYRLAHKLLKKYRGEAASDTITVFRNYGAALHEYGKVCATDVGRKGNLQTARESLLMAKEIIAKTQGSDSESIITKIDSRLKQISENLPFVPEEDGPSDCCLC